MAENGLSPSLSSQGGEGEDISDFCAATR